MSSFKLSKSLSFAAVAVVGLQAFTFDTTFDSTSPFSSILFSHALDLNSEFSSAFSSVSAPPVYSLQLSGDNVDPTNPIPYYAEDDDAPTVTLVKVTADMPIDANAANDDDSVLKVWYSEQWKQTGSNYLQIVTNQKWSSRQQGNKNRDFIAQ